MFHDVTVFNIREYLSVKDDKVLGEEALRQLLSEFSYEKNPDVERFLKEQSINEEKLMHFYENKNGFKRFDTKEIKSGTEDAHTLVQLLKIL